MPRSPQNNSSSHKFESSATAHDTYKCGWSQTLPRFLVVMSCTTSQPCESNTNEMHLPYPLHREQHCRGARTFAIAAKLRPLRTMWFQISALRNGKLGARSRRSQHRHRIDLDVVTDQRPHHASRLFNHNIIHSFSQPLNTSTLSHNLRNKRDRIH
jgi:hypothetical protein